MLLRKAVRLLGLIRSAARCIPDPRRQAGMKHALRQMLAQRVARRILTTTLSRATIRNKLIRSINETRQRRLSRSLRSFAVNKTRSCNIRVNPMY